MKRKLIAGTIIMALTLTTGIAAYAAAGSQKDQQPKDGVIYRDEISMDGEGALSFEDMDKDNLPDGVTYRDEISMDGEGALSFEDMDKDNLPDGVTYRDEISMGTDVQTLPLD